MNDKIYCKIYQDDGKQVWKGIKPVEQLINWLDWFQQKVNLLLGLDKLKFMMIVWKPPMLETMKEIAKLGKRLELCSRNDKEEEIETKKPK